MQEIKLCSSVCTERTAIGGNKHNINSNCSQIRINNIPWDTETAHPNFAVYDVHHQLCKKPKTPMHQTVSVELRVEDQCLFAA